MAPKKENRLPQEVIDLIRSCARGSYQTDLLSGAARWSGRDLKGKARKFKLSYINSQHNLLNRITSALAEPVAGVSWVAFNTLVPMSGRWTRTLVIRRQSPGGSRHNWYDAVTGMPIEPYYRLVGTSIGSIKVKHGSLHTSVVAAKRMWKWKVAQGHKCDFQITHQFSKRILWKSPRQSPMARLAEVLEEGS